MEHEQPASFGGRVRQARLRLGADRNNTLSQTEVGKAMGVSQVTVGRWESGDEPALETIVRLAAVLRTTPGHLAFGELANVVPEMPHVERKKPGEAEFTKRSASKAVRVAGRKRR